MSGKKRTKEEIIAEILRSACRKASKSRIMYDGFLNYSQLEKYLAYVLGAGLITKDGNLYSITDKGRDYLNLFEKSRGDIGTNKTILSKFLR